MGALSPHNLYSLPLPMNNLKKYNLLSASILSSNPCRVERRLSDTMHFMIPSINSGGRPVSSQTRGFIAQT